MVSPPPGSMSFEDFEISLLALLGWATDNQGGGEFNLYTLVGSQDWDVEPGWIEKSYISLFDKNLIELTKSDTSAYSLARITEAGRKQAITFLESMDGDYSPRSSVGTQLSNNYANTELTYRQFKDLLLIALVDRWTKSVDETGEPIDDVANYPYSLKWIADDQHLLYQREWLDRSVSELYHEELIDHRGVDEHGNDRVLVTAAAIVLVDRIAHQYYLNRYPHNSRLNSTDDDYFKHRAGLFISLVHASDVLGPGMHPVTFALNEMVENIRPELVERAAIDLQNLGLAEFGWPNQAITMETLGGINGQLTDLGWEVYGSEYKIFGLPQGPDSAPAADRTVTLDHNRPNYQEAVVSLEKVIAAYRDDHRINNEFPSEKSAILGALEAGNELLKDTRLHLNVATHLLIEPLRILAKKYERELIGALAAAALTTLLKLFGLG